MELIQQLSSKNDCYKNNVNKADSRYATFQSRGPLGLMLHSVGCPQPKAQVFADTWNQAGKEVAVHAVIEPGKVIQCLPWNFRGWHGGGDSNNTHIGVEMTEPATIKYTGGATWVETGDGTKTKAHVLGTYKTAVELFASLCAQYKLDPLKDGVIISHAEGCKRGIASNHGDPEHLWSKHGLTMNQFRQDIKAAMTGSATPPGTSAQTTSGTSLYRVRKTATDSASQVGAYSVLENAKKAASDNKWYKVFDTSGNLVYDPAVVVKSAVEITVDNAIADGVLTDRAHWLGVLGGTIVANKENIKIVFDRYHDKLNK